MSKKQMTIEQLILSMFRAASLPPTEEEYKILCISKLNIVKRKRFLNIYRILILFLIKKSLPEAFSRYSQSLMEAFNNSLQLAYEDNLTARERIEDKFIIFEDLVKFDEKEPFLDLALYIAELFEDSPRKIVYAAKLNKVIEDMFFNFSTMGKRVAIIEG